MARSPALAGLLDLEIIVSASSGHRLVPIMQHHLPIYLHTTRKHWGLSQAELALLLRIAQSNLSRFESLEREPTLNVVIGSEIIFGKSPRELFPALYGEFEDKVMRQAKLLHDKLEGRTDFSAQEKLRLLTEMMGRVNPE